MSSDDWAIRVDSLSKRYQIYNRPSDRLRQFVLPRIRRVVGRPAPDYFTDFWAVKDVSFEIRRGDTVGIVGRNGSGKSTLLQLICGTLMPTSGSVETRGRVAALLELGAGFNPEFTGRENVFLNATLFGLDRAQIVERFDRIAAFADIGAFIDQPVKTYSSGMYVRLAFAVIAHVDADILIVDEALSVGDAVFTQKCMRFIRAFQQRGTLLFVSHDMGSVQNLCKKSLWLGHGQMRQFGESKGVVEAYLRYTLQEVYGDEAALQESESTVPPTAGVDPAGETAVDDAATLAVAYEARAEVSSSRVDDARGWKTGVAEILSVALEKADGASTAVFEGGERVRMVVEAMAHEALDQPIVGFIVKDRLGQDLFGENTLPLTAQSPRTVPMGTKFRAVYTFRLPMLPNGSYAVMASVANGDLYENVQHHYLHDALIIHVSSSKVRWGLVGIPFEKIALEVEDV
ncbi:ATP-binding cassette domain-containing protein [Xylophilus sp. Kf1]|nr:ATP-binding cassette domain-containing protein [Xylophilus sp. Kf1]